MDNNSLRGISGLPNDSVWSQAVTFTTVGGSDVSFFVCLTVESNSELLDIPMIGLSIVEEIRLAATSCDNWKLEQLKNLLSDVAGGIGDGVVIAIGIVVTDRTNVSIAALGNVSAILRRSGVVHKLLVQSQGAQGVVGKIVQGDVMCVVSERLIDPIEVTSENDTPKAIEQIIHTPLGVGAAAIIYAPKPAMPAAPSLPNIKVKPFNTESERLKTYFGLALLAVLFLTIGVGMWRRSLKIQEKGWQELQTSVNRVKEEVGELAKTDPEAAQRALNVVSENVSTYKKVAKGQYITRAEFVSQEIAQLTTAILMQNEVDLTTWIELSLIGIEGSPKQLVSNEGGVVYIATAPELVGISLADRSQVKSSISGVTEPTVDWLIQNGYLYVLNNSGVFSGKMGEKIELARRVEPDEAWQTPSRILGFGGSQYILDIGSGEISKYVIESDGVSTRKRWFGAGIVLDLSRIVDVVVDGDVWLLSSSGKLERYSRGAPVVFSMEGYANAQGEKRFAQPVAVATTEEEVFVLEREKSRVVVFGKDGKYLRQYLNDGFVSANDLLIWDGKGYVLTEKEIKVFEL